MSGQEIQQNMISNLPLLFANGYPTSLDKITEAQLENFIPFMVQCSLGHVNIQDKIECSEPEWWPENILFMIPFTKPKEFIGSWMDKMKEIVIICYQFHKSVFLLRFCNDLASYEHASLRFINNYNSTTSLFDRRSNKLLVTFRNENMSYDQLQRNRKCLLQQKSKYGYHIDVGEHKIMVEPAPFDIYLCDNCDAELYSKEAITEHEKACNGDVHDVILIDTPEPLEENNLLNMRINAANNEEVRIEFLLNFCLQLRTNAKNFDSVGELHGKSMNFLADMSSRDENSYIALNTSKKVAGKCRSVNFLARCPTIPLSSPAGQLLIRTAKTCITEDYLSERLERIERFCHAPTLTSSAVEPKYLEKGKTTFNVHTFKRPRMYSAHVYVFPRRQFSQRRRAENFIFFNSSLINKCRPISVRLKKINEFAMKRKISKVKLNIKLTRDTGNFPRGTFRGSKWKISSSSSEEIIVDTIDLCSSGDNFDKAAQSFVEQLANPFGYNQCVPKSLNAILPLACFDKNIGRFQIKEMENLLPSEYNWAPKRPVPDRSKELKNMLKTTSSFVFKKLPDAILQQMPEVGKSTLFEANIHFASPAVSTENLLKIPKPLHQSVYIFANYMTSRSLAIIAESGNGEISQINETLLQSGSCKTQCQESKLKGLAISSGTKSISGVLLNSNTHSVNWLSQVSDFHNHPLSITHPSDKHRYNTCKNKTTHVHVTDCECTLRNIPFFQSFSSPTHVTSIDLTS